MEKQKKDNKIKSKKINTKKKIIIGTLCVFMVLIAGAIGVYMNLRNNIYIKTTPEEMENVNYKEVEGITNVLLLGTDGRTLDEPARSDAIIIATLDNNNKVVKTTSIMRDTLVDIPGHGEQKINAAFAIGSAEGGVEEGVKLLNKTLEQNFNISVNKYAIVNFWGFESIINEIGGIEVDVKDYEINELNKYTGDSTGTKSELITEPGVHKLNGAQALSYSRIRKVGDGSFERTKRQRFVLTKVAEKLKDTNPIKYIGIANEISKYVKTNMDIPECLNLAYTIFKLPELKIEQLQIPQNELVVRDGLYKDKGWVLIVDKKQNSKVIDEFIYENKLPNPENFDKSAIESLKAKYSSDEEKHNSTHGINPNDYNDKDKEDEINIPRKTPSSSKPEKPKLPQQSSSSDNNSDNPQSSNGGQSSSGSQETPSEPNNSQQKPGSSENATSGNDGINKPDKPSTPDSGDSNKTPGTQINR